MTSLHPVTLCSEGTLSGSTSLDGGDPLWSSTSSFLYESSLVTVTLGRHMWGLRQPAYGFNGIVQGAIQLSRKCTHVVRVEVSLLGRARVTLSDRGLISEQVHRNLLTSPIVLSCPPRDVYTPTEECLPFVIPFPSHVANGTSPLPPSCAWWSSTFTTEVEYCVRVDVHRKGLRRHELRIIPIMYLPKTWPSHPISSRESISGSLSSSTVYKTVSLHPVWPPDVPPKAKATVPTVELFYPSNATYPSGQTIHLRLSIESTEAPALALLLIQGLEAQLVKYMVARTQSGRVVGGREIVLSRGNVTEINTIEEGFAVSYFDLTLGEPGKEQSWAIDDDIKVTYLIRVSVSCADSALNFVPTYKHASRIGVATETWALRERGLLGFGGFSNPAIGMSDERLERKRVSNVNVGWQ
ncbi:hypothetical protein V8E52_002544 [Russula decolorans]